MKIDLDLDCLAEVSIVSAVVLAFLDKQDSYPVTPKEAATAFPHLDPKTMRYHLQKLTEGGFLDQQTGYSETGSTIMVYDRVKKRPSVTESS